MSQYTQFTAVVKGLRVITVIAEDLADARTQVAVELNRNPSRRQALTPWVEGGKKMVWTDESGQPREDSVQ